MKPKRKKKSEATKVKQKKAKAHSETQASVQATEEKAPSEPSIKELVGSLEAEQQQTEELRKKLSYLQAEYQNFQKSMMKREAQIVSQASRKLILQLLPVVDDLQRAIIMVPVLKENEPSIEGLKMVLDGLQKTLREAGVKPIEAEGQVFDPLRHEAVVREESTVYPPNMVIDELRKGYLLNGALLRPSMVKIAVSPVQQVEKKEKQPVKSSNRTEKKRKTST